jgi:hypothetical protein
MRQPKSFAAMALGANSFWPIDRGYIALNSAVLQCGTAKDVYLWTWMAKFLIYPSARNCSPMEIWRQMQTGGPLMILITNAHKGKTI